MTLAEAAARPTGDPQKVSNRDKIMMLIATAARMGVALLGFIAMARFLGPENFGVVATAAAYSGFISIVSDFGLTVSALRTSAAEPERAAEILTDAFATKLLLTVAAGAIALGVALAVLPVQLAGVYAMIFAGVLAYAFADLAMVAARARRRFDVEAAVVVTTSVAMLLVVAGTAAITRSLEATAAAFVLTRFAYLGATLIVLRRRLGVAIGWRRLLPQIARTLKLSSGYAVDSVLTTLSTQIDVLLFALYLTIHDMGIYQAGARLVQVILPFAVVLSTVYMPTLSSAAIKGETGLFRHTARRINIEFGALALIAALGFTFLGPVVTRLIYGESYAALVPLWTGFGAFALLRLMAASYGIQLTALGFIRTRIGAQIASIVLFSLSVWLVMPHYGLAVTSWLLGLSGLPVLLVSSFALIRHGHTDLSLFATLAISLAMLAVLALF